MFSRFFSLLGGLAAVMSVSSGLAVSDVQAASRDDVFFGSVAGTWSGPGEIVAGKRSITADTDLRLCRYFGLSDGWWLRGQAAYDTAMAREALQAELATIQRCSLLAA